MHLGPLAPGPDTNPPMKDLKELTELKPDILEVEVTRVCSGACQYRILLNNWYDALPRDRQKGLGANEVMSPSTGEPFWPRFKYDDFKVFDFGDRLRIDMRYWPDPDSTLTAVDASAQRWVPMISGPISDIQWLFSNEEGARVEIRGEDDLCALKNKNPKKQDYWARPEAEIVADVLTRANFPLPLAPPLIPWPTFTGSQAQALAEAHFEGQSYLDYLMHFAERWDFEVFIEYASLDDAS